jgi:hypothetical protein
MGAHAVRDKAETADNNSNKVFTIETLEQATYNLTIA